MIALLLAQLIPDGAAVERVAGGYVAGLAVDGDGAVWFSDGARLLRHDGREARPVRDGGARALAFDAEGRLLVCENGRLARIEGDDATVLADAVDLAVDDDGAIYFTHGGAVHRLTPDGARSRVAGDFAGPGALAIAGATLYVADEDRIVAIDGKRRVFADGAGNPTGMTADSKGRLYAACDDGVRVWDADGKLVATIAVPERPSNCAFGGNVLYIAAGTSLYRIKLNAEGR